ncbi:MAG: hypothetical protein ABIJ56_10245 [Pseudomonadota bacterium]
MKERIGSIAGASIVLALWIIDGGVIRQSYVGVNPGETAAKTETMREKVEPPPPPPPARMSETDFVSNRWAASQRQGNAAFYGGLLAQDFTAATLKTGREKKKQYSKEKWLKHRSNVLSKGMNLDVGNFSVRRLSMGESEVRFTYFYNTEEYCDSGDKLLRLRPEGSSWKIVREEILSAKECTFASYATFGTFIGTFASSLRGSKWDYIREHSANPLHVTESGIARAFNAINKNTVGSQLQPMRWARAKKKTVSKTVGDKLYKYTSTYDEEGSGSIFVEVLQDGNNLPAKVVFLGEYTFEFQQGQWVLTEIGCMSFE